MGAASKRIALGGILGAIAVATLYIESIVPAGKLGFFVISSLFTAMMVMEAGVKSAWTFYIAVSILSFFIIPDKLTVIPYIAFFGLYGIFKYYIEKLDKRMIEYIFKLIYFNICLFAAYFLARELILGNIHLELPLYLLAIALQFVFLIYDYIFTRMIDYYRQRVKKIM